MSHRKPTPTNVPSGSPKAGVKLSPPSKTSVGQAAGADSSSKGNQSPDRNRARRPSQSGKKSNSPSPTPKVKKEDKDLFYCKDDAAKLQKYLVLVLQQLYLYEYRVWYLPENGARHLPNWEMDPGSDMDVFHMLLKNALKDHASSAGPSSGTIGKLRNVYRTYESNATIQKNLKQYNTNVSPEELKWMKDQAYYRFGPYNKSIGETFTAKGPEMFKNTPPPPVRT